MNYWYDKTFDYITYTIDSSSWIDKEVVDTTTTFPCRVTEMSFNDLNLIWWDKDNDKQKRKLYTLPTIDFTKWQIIEYNLKKRRILKQYKPTDLSWTIYYTKVFIMEV